MADQSLLVLSTFPDLATAKKIGRQLVEQHCAACANILPAVESIYWWEGKVEEGKEVLVVFKTTAERYSALETTLRALHPYDLPEIVAFRVDRGSDGYLAWVAESCQSPERG